MNVKSPIEGNISQDVDDIESGEEVFDGDSAILSLTREAYESSTTYMDANLRRQWERNINNFYSRHPPGSKYHSSAYKGRSRVFRPKTRAAVRQNEAAAVAAFFSTRDVVDITPEDSSNPEAQISADMIMELVNYRLTGKSIPWFKIIISTFQDAMVSQSCVARAEWEYEVKETDEEELVGMNEDGTLKYQKKKKTIRDQPAVYPIPNENIRIDPAANMMDPINTSPYVIELMPMHINDVRAKMGKVNPKTGEPAWRKLDDSQLQTALAENSNDTTRQARENNRQDQTDNTTSITGHEIVWVYRTIMEIGGEDMQWYTLGTTYVLTDPVPLREVVLHGMRPYVMGYAVIEAHRLYPSSLVELGQELQAASNDNFNLRFDNVKQGLNARNFVRRAAQVDLRALKRSVPGGIVMVGDPARDVKPIPVKDVSNSSYAEQDRLNSDFDEVMGSFSQSSIQTNRNLNETVGGMGMIKDNSNVMTEYVIRTYAETFVEELIRHIIELERAYETDEKILRIAADRAKIPQDQPVTSEMLNYAVEISVDVGYGATDSVRKMQKFSMAINTAAVVPGLGAKLDEDAVVTEVFGNAGYKNGAKFFKGLGEEQQGPPPIPPEIELKMQELQIKQAEIQMKAQNENTRMMLDRELGYAKIAADREIKLSTLYDSLGVKSGELDLKKKGQELAVLKELGRREETAQKREELAFKARTGKDGI